MASQRYTEDEFKEAVRSSGSIAVVLRKLGLKPAGGNYGSVKRGIRQLGLDASHFTGQGHLKGRTHNWAKKTPTSEILVKDCEWGGKSSALRVRLIREGYFERKCYGCDRTTWMRQPIPLELEHRNGDSRDNRLENLTLLCPNCHAQTPTYRGKNIAKDSKAT